MLYILTWLHSIKEVILHIIGLSYPNDKFTLFSTLYYNRIT